MSQPDSPTDVPVMLPEAGAAAREGYTVPMQRLAPQVLLLWMLSGLITLVVVGVLAALAEVYWLRRAEWYTRLPVPGWSATMLATVLLGVVPLALAPLQYRRWSYAIRERDVLIESGLIWRVRRSIPRARVQHVDIRSGPIDRMLGVVQVDLHTAGSVGPVASIPGLAPDAAEQLREALVGETYDGL